MKIVSFLTVLSMLYSCEPYDKTRSSSAFKHIPFQSVFDDIKQFEEGKKHAIVINKDNVRRLNASTAQIGQEIDKLMFGPDSVSLWELENHTISFRNNDGKLISIPLKVVIERIE